MILISLFLLHFFCSCSFCALPAVTPFQLSLPHLLDPFLKCSCGSRCSLSCICVDDSLMIIKRGLKVGFCTGEAIGLVQLLLKSHCTDSFSYTSYSAASYFSWNSGMSNSLLHTSCHPLLFGAVFQSKMCPVFCGMLFIILKDSFLRASRTSENSFYCVSTSIFLSGTGRYRGTQLPECGECELLSVVTSVLHDFEQGEVGSSCLSAQ